MPIPCYCVPYDSNKQLKHSIEATEIITQYLESSSS